MKGMAGDFDVERYRPLLKKAHDAFRTDTAYAIAVAQQAGALIARRTQEEVPDISSVETEQIAV